MPAKCVDGRVTTESRPPSASGPAGMLDGAYRRRGSLCASVIVGLGCIRYDAAPPEGGLRRCNVEAHNAAVVEMATSGIRL